MSRYPLVLSRPAIRRILDRKASLLILSRRLQLGRLEVHDGLIVKRNGEAKRHGRTDKQEEPLAFTIELVGYESCLLHELDFVTIHKAGFQTTEEFRVDWGRRRVSDAHVYGFRMVADVRFLHQRVHRGYTSEPSLAAQGEPEALSHADLQRLSRLRWTQDDRLEEAAKRSIGLRARMAASSGDLGMWRDLGRELAAICSNQMDWLNGKPLVEHAHLRSESVLAETEARRRRMDAMSGAGTAASA